MRRQWMQLIGGFSKSRGGGRLSGNTVHPDDLSGANMYDLKTPNTSFSVIFGMLEDYRG